MSHPDPAASRRYLQAHREMGWRSHGYLRDSSWCLTNRLPCEEWIQCSGLMQLKHILTFRKPLTCSFYLKSFCKYYCNILSRLEGKWGLSVSALTDSFPLSHITNHFLSTYPIFKAFFSPDGRNEPGIKVKPHCHTYTQATRLIIWHSPPTQYLHPIKKTHFSKICQ